MLPTMRRTSPGLLGLDLEIRRLSNHALWSQFVLLCEHIELRRTGSLGAARYQLILAELERRSTRCA